MLSSFTIFLWLTTIPVLSLLLYINFRVLSFSDLHPVAARRLVVWWQTNRITWTRVTINYIGRKLFSPASPTRSSATNKLMDQREIGKNKFHGLQLQSIWSDSNGPVAAL